MLTLADGLTLTSPDSGRPFCVFRTSGDGGFVIETLDRRRPVFVNGLPASTRILEPHDELRIGDSLFIVAPDEPVLLAG